MATFPTTDTASPAQPETQPSADTSETLTTKPRPHPEPTRYGDWEMHGKCVDF